MVKAWQRLTTRWILQHTTHLVSSVEIGLVSDS